MELLVLSTLRWKMQAFTPCSFIDYFLSKTTYDQHLSKSFISKSLQLILGITKCTPFILYLNVVFLHWFSLGIMSLNSACWEFNANMQCRYRLLGILAFWDCCCGDHLRCRETSSNGDWESHNLFCDCRKGKDGDFID